MHKWGLSQKSKHDYGKEYQTKEYIIVNKLNYCKFKFFKIVFDWYHYNTDYSFFVKALQLQLL